MAKEREHKPWDRQEDEGTKAFEAFKAYRDMGPKRGIRRVPAVLGRPDTYKPVLERWSVKYGWVKRAQAWDDFQDKVAQEAALTQIEEMRKRHIQQSVALQTKALQRLQSLDPRELSASNVLGFIAEAIKIERMARGEPETILEERRKLSHDDAKIISELAADPEFLRALQRAVDETEGSPAPDSKPGHLA
jgi:hypothetical protein